MLNLLRADFYRIKKDIVLIIALILLVIFALMLPLLYYAMSIVGGDSLAELEAIGMSISFSGKSVFVSSMSLTNNFGLILPVLIGILVCRDFTTGTVRNKIISGHSKASVYLSHAVSAAATGAALFALYSLLSLAFGVLILGYGSEFNSGELIYLIKTLLMGILIFAAVISLAVFFSAITRNTGVTIVLQIFSSLFIMVLGTVPMMLPNVPGWLENLLKFNPAYQINVVASGTVSNEIFIISLISSAAYIAILTLAGTLIFRKADQK